MAEPKPTKDAAAQDPSMDEILESIKRIIAEDDGDSPGDGASEEAPVLEEEDILELTDIVEEDGTVTTGGGNSDVLDDIDSLLARDEAPLDDTIKPLSADDIDAIMGDDDMTKHVEFVDAPEPEPEPNIALEELETAMTTDDEAPLEDLLPPPPPETEEEAEAPISIDSLLSQEAASATAAAFKQITALQQESPHAHTASPTFRSGTTVEDLVVEALKPMLSDWLNANLPGLVEEIVQREIRKLLPR